MIVEVESLVFRHLTYADFWNINKTGGEEKGGGGQSYIDFPTSKISVQDWYEFLERESEMRTKGPAWTFPIKSQGLQQIINLTIYQRRNASVSISSQKVESIRSNRVPSWHPDNGFPEDYDHTSESLVIYIVKTKENRYWAGWILYEDEYDIPYEKEGLENVFNNEAGYLKYNNIPLLLNTNQSNWGFHLRSTTHNTDEETGQIEHLFNEDTTIKLQGEDEDNDNDQVQERVVKYRIRNRKLVRKLKELYNGHCQITGSNFTFKKPNGDYYAEVHHLIPLGEKGSDSYANMIVVSPLIHRMLHYADVSDINLDDIEDNELEITINGEPHTIRWDQQHRDLIQEVINED